MNRASIDSSDVPDVDNIPPFLPPTTEAGFIEAIKAAASLARITFNDKASPDELLLPLFAKAPRYTFVEPDEGLFG